LAADRRLQVVPQGSSLRRIQNAPTTTMNRIKGKTVLVTGASAGIGEACALAFADFGADLILTARRVDRLEALRDEIETESEVHVRIAGLDVRDFEAVRAFVAGLEAEGVEIDILVNNAGLSRGLESIQSGDPEGWDEMIDTNVKGLLYVSRCVLPGMVERNRGHVVNIGSIAGRQVYPKGNVYNASKFAVRAINEGMNLDLFGTDIRVSSIDPGLVETEFSLVRFHGDEDRAEKVYQGYKPLQPEDIADAVCYVVNAPPHVDIVEMMILPTDQRNAYMVHKQGQ
jgi:3-hydroxy acid dehydrogenase/malonic semialdehyde reductase